MRPSRFAIPNGVVYRRDARCEVDQDREIQNVHVSPISDSDLFESFITEEYGGGDECVTDEVPVFPKVRLRHQPADESALRPVDERRNRVFSQCDVLRYEI